MDYGINITNPSTRGIAVRVPIIGNAFFIPPSHTLGVRIDRGMITINRVSDVHRTPRLWFRPLHVLDATWYKDVIAVLPPEVTYMVTNFTIM